MGLSDRALRELMRILETGRVPTDGSAASDLYYAVREALESRVLLRERSAAPELLTMLTRWVQFADDNGYQDADYVNADGSSWLAESRAAIARARGK